MTNSENIYFSFCEAENEFCTKKSIDSLKKMIDIYIEAYKKDVVIGEHEIVDSTIMILSNNPDHVLIEYLEKKREGEESDDLKEEIGELIKLVDNNIK